VLRPATAADRDLVLAWRNHPEVRAVSLNQHLIGADEHAAWWDRAMADPARRILIYEREGRPAGVVTFFDYDEQAACASWGYYVDLVGLEAVGQTLLAWIEIQREAVSYAFDELGLDVLRGEVLASNEAVRQLNRRQRFVEVNSRSVTIGGVETEVLDIELRAADRQRRHSPRSDPGKR
jgi:UDP-4-amino-4,6-dideoxy-N-acetyl-beta-L-altrosamine N-acetyltransferase